MKKLMGSIWIILFSVLLAVACSPGDNEISSDEDNQDQETPANEYTQSETVSIRFNYGDDATGMVAGETDGGHIYWKGIPYAASPSGDNRFKGPQPVAPWSGIKATTEFGAECHNGISETEADGVSEDCLYLNVFAPKTKPAPSSLVPVIFFIHGGGFKYGSANNFDGKWWVEDGYDGKPVVLVTINYRLGPFGFVYHPAITDAETVDTDASTLTRTDDSWGNWGLRDQIKALEWVKENIAEFGGNPDNVTIMGESAGCWSVLTHLTSPLSEGLFHKAICQSQGPIINSIEEAQLLGEQLLGPDYMACLDGEPTPLQCLKDAPADAFTEAHQKFANSGDYNGYVGVMDGNLYPDHPFHTLENGQQHKVPLLIGYNEDEIPPALMTEIINVSAYDMAVDALFSAVRDQTDETYTARDVENDIRRFKAYYSRRRWGTYQNALARYQTDIFACQEMEVARLHQAHVDDVYMYYWHWPDYIDNHLPAMHASEMDFLFNRPEPYESYQLDMHLNMVNFWSKFAYDGDPWDYAWAPQAAEKAWAPFTSLDYAIYEIGSWNEMQTHLPGGPVPQSDTRCTSEGCQLLMTIARGHFKYRWAGMKHTDAQVGVSMRAYFEGLDLRFWE